MTRPYLIEKSLSLLAILPPILLLPPQSVLWLFIVLGQGHFFLAYLYQYKAGKITRTYLVWFGLLFASLFSIFFWFGSFEWLVVLTGTQFLIHFLQDEVFLAGETHSLFTSLEAAALVSLFFGILYDTVFGATLSTYTAALGLALVTLYFLLAIEQRYFPNRTNYFVLFIIALLLGIEFTGFTVPVEILLGALILFHYAEWYIHFFFKLRKNKTALRTYLVRVAVINSALITLFFIYSHWFSFQGPLAVLFAPFFFYLWTLMHTLTSVRLADYKNALRIP